MRNLTWLAAALFVAFGLSCDSTAALLLSDSFDYPEGALVTAAGSSWRTISGTTGEVRVVSGRAMVSQTNSEDVVAPFAGQPYAAATNLLLYAGFTLNLTALPGGSGTYFASFCSPSTYRGRLFVTTNGAPAGNFRLGIANGAASPAISLSSNLVPNTEYVVVLRYATSNAVVTLWLNPAAESDFGVTAGDSVSSISTYGLALRESLSSGSGMGTLLIDNLAVGTSFAEAVANPGDRPLGITSNPQDLVVAEGANAVFSVGAGGAPPIAYQWRFRGADLPGEVAPDLVLSNVVSAQSGPYSVVASNGGGMVTSAVATLTVVPAAQQQPVPSAISVLTYNVKGNGVTDFSTNTAQVQAIGRQVAFLSPDIITFNEIPNNQVNQMPGFAAAFLPGYYLATNSIGDGYIRTVILSRYPIVFSQSYLHATSLAPYGYTASAFTRDLFLAQVAAPGFTQPIDVYVTHLKATTSSPQADADKRAAEACAITNFFWTNYVTSGQTGFGSSNGLRPILLNGDLNEDINRPDTNRYTSGQPIQKLVGGTGLRLATPVNPVTGSDLTLSIQATLNVRFDYILPNGLLFSNIISSQVFRTDLLPNPPAPLLGTDDKTASDHLPVLMVFANPYRFALTSIARADQNVTLTWNSLVGQPYRVEASPDLLSWQLLAKNLVASNASFSFTTNSPEAVRFFRVRTP